MVKCITACEIHSRFFKVLLTNQFVDNTVKMQCVLESCDKYVSRIIVNMSLIMPLFMYHC